MVASNIRNLIVSWDLYTEVMHYYSQAHDGVFFHADVKLILLYDDNALYVSKFIACKWKFNCSYILGGHNHSTEGVALSAELRFGV